MLSSSRCLWLLFAASFQINYSGVVGGFACLSNPCVHGICIDDLNTTYSCYCIDGYTGIQCQTNWDECWSNPCQNGGMCRDGIAEFNCSCMPGFVGDFCEEDYNECDSNPCLNNGSCIDGHNGYNCFCPPGFLGIHCEIDVAVCNATNETRCNNGGVCEEGPGVTFTCNCKPGWGGFLCESEIDECMSAPCQNGAVCIDLHADYSCACLFGYTGKNCEEVIMRCQTSHCKNGALCLTEEGHPVCYCVPDFHGDKCQYQYDECQLGPKCMNGGTCIDGIDSFSCSCPPNLTGVLCECLIINNNQLDCSYTTPSTTMTTQLPHITNYTTIEVTTASWDFNFTSSTLPSITYVPNGSTSIQTSTEFTTAISTTFSITDLSSNIIFTTREFSTVPETTTDEFTSELPSTSTELYSTSVIYLTSTDKATTEELKTEESSTEIHESSIATSTVVATQEETESTLPSISVWTSKEPENLTTSEVSIISTTSIAATSTTVTEVSETSSKIDVTSTTETTATTLPIVITTLPTTLSSFFTDVPHIVTNATLDSTYLTDETTTFLSTVKTETSSAYTMELTTLGRENATKAIVPDCTKPGSECKNGGTCTFVEEGYMCLCPHDAEGIFCEFKLGVKNAAFSGDSYLTHRLINTTRTDIEFKTKTLSPNGLIFYSNIDTSYIALYLEHGYLKFIFSCGYQTMLLSELNNLVNNGFDMTISAQLEFSKNFKKCTASLMINNTLTMSGQQVAVVNLLIKPLSLLHLGGLPQEKLKEQIPYMGFTGCITDLKIFGKHVEVFREAEDGFKISECSSLACLSNPCNNEGLCTENGHSWHCNCKNGYLGKFCEHSVCDNNPCLYGGTCLTFAGNGYICLCPYGKHGHYCENNLEIFEPHFSSSIQGYSSYAAYSIPTGGISSSMELKFKISPTSWDQIAILVFIGQAGLHDAFSDHLAVSFVKGYIMLTWNLGSGPRRIFTTKAIVKGKDSYLIHLGRVGRRAWLFVDGVGNVTGRSPGNLVQMDVMPVIFLGGHSSPNFSMLPHDLPLHTGFSGCIFDVELKSGNLIIPLQSSRHVVGRSLGQCNTNECHENLCQNGGACLHHGATFTCLCQDGWYGPLCSSKYNPCDFNTHNCSSDSTCVPLLMGYECDCPVGKVGTYCNNSEKLSDVSLNGKRSYITIKPTIFEISKFSIELQIRPLSDRGLILFIGGENTFLSINMQSALLELRIIPAKRKINLNDVLSIRSNKLLAMGLWYKIRVKKFGNKLNLQVDDVVNTAILHNGDYLSLSEKNINLGGLPDLSKLPNAATASTPTPFKGCIRQLRFDNLHIPLTPEFITDGQNIADCDGTPCGSDSCENGGTCWLDSYLNPHCLCVDPYFGQRCENLQSCEETPCQNRGKCVNTKCSCLTGYTGAFCENSIQVKIPEFFGNSHLILKKTQDKRRDSSGQLLKKLYLNFTTVEENGLLLWSSKGKNFIGIGIERGFIKLVYSIKSSNKTVIEMLPSRSITDGFWHTLELSLISMQLQVYLDKRLLLTHRNKIKIGDLISTNDMFYLGGMPSNHSILEYTYGLFSQPFSGCIEVVTFNDEKRIADFTSYEGENVGVCTA